MKRLRNHKFNTYASKRREQSYKTIKKESVSALEISIFFTIQTLNVLQKSLCGVCMTSNAEQLFTLNQAV
ncbi:MAG: hypothetical protein SNH27_12660 [Rikenellaceae bacterium]